MRKTGIFLKKHVPPFARALLLLTLFAAMIYAVARFNAPFADLLNRTVCHALRRTSAFVTDVFPFSVAELLVILSPVALAAILFLALRAKDKEGRIRFLAGLLSVAFTVLSAYWFTLGMGYRTTELAERIELDGVEVDADSLYATLEILTQECNTLAEELMLDGDGSSVIPISFSETSDYIIEAYEILSEKMPSLGIKNFDSRAKRVMLSKQMSALEITGVYTFFTGEANVNVYYPDYNVPFTVAHELAHQRGIARENEANFVAFLVCAEAEHPYIRYSGYMNMLEYVASALRRTDADKYRTAYECFSDTLISEMRAYSEFYKNNKKPFWSKVSDTVNDTYLKVQGTEGIVSYSLVVRLCVAYLTEAR